MTAASVHASWVVFLEWWWLQRTMQHSRTLFPVLFGDQRVMTAHSSVPNARARHLQSMQVSPSSEMSQCAVRIVNYIAGSDEYGHLNVHLPHTSILTPTVFYSSPFSIYSPASAFSLVQSHELQGPYLRSQVKWTGTSNQLSQPYSRGAHSPAPQECQLSV